MSIYKGNAKIRESGAYGIYHGSNPIGAVFKGSELVYIFNRELTWQAGTSLASYTVPSYVHKIRVDCVASRGFNGRANGGKGGRVQCVMDVTPNQVLYITVGSIPSSVRTPEYNASDIRTNNSGITNSTSLSSRLLVAGGGGSGGSGSRSTSAYSGAGGAGGGTTGANGSATQQSRGGYGGTQSTGGAGGTSSGIGGASGTAGSFGVGGTGATSGGGAGAVGAGAGGAGWYGGGGGARQVYGDSACAGGGGGSSYTSSACSNVTHTQGYQNGAGYITITEIG